MKYLVLIYANPQTWEHPMFGQDPGFLGLPPDEQETIRRRADELRQQLLESGELLGGEMLAAPDQARTVRIRKGERTITDGPFAETKEHLAGFVVLDCASRKRAVEIVASFPDARFIATELRPLA